MIPPDSEERLLATLQVLFAQELQTKVAGDSLALLTLKQAPLQDDPTQVAPYLVYEKDPDLGIRRMKQEEAREYGEMEIGGPLRYLVFYRAIMGTPLATTREQAQASINNLMARVMTVLTQNFSLAGIMGAPEGPDGLMRSEDLSQLIEGANPYLIDASRTRIYGGEQTWYGEGHLTWHYPVSWYVQYFAL